MSALTNAQQAYRLAAVYETTKALTLTAQFQSAQMIAKKHNLNVDATRRFLNAAVSLGLLERNDGTEKYALNGADAPQFSNQSSLILFWLIRHKIPDLLAKRPKTLSELKTENNGCNEAQLLSAVKYELLRNDGDQYALPEETKEYLLSTSEKYIGPMVQHFERVMFPMFSVDGLFSALKSGKSQWGRFFDKHVTNPFTLYQNEPKLLDTFTRGMHQLNITDNAALVPTLSIADAKTMLDVGGGSGALAIEILKHHKALQIDIYEFYDAVPLMKTIFYDYTPNETRVRFISGCFLEDNTSLVGLNENTQYDLITLAWILHDWADETCISILEKIRMHLTPDGQLIILEAILPENRLGQPTMHDLAMLLQTEGKERTFVDYKSLLYKAGFKTVNWTPTETKRQAIIAKF